MLLVRTCTSDYRPAAVLFSVAVALGSLRLTGGSAHTKRRLQPEQEKQFLAVLGLNKVPSGASKHHIRIPDFLKEQYFQQTGLEVDSSSFRMPGAHTTYANTVRTFSGKVHALSQKESVLHFDFVKQPYSAHMEAESEAEAEAHIEPVHSAVLKVYWKPHLSIKRSRGSFKIRVYDLLKSYKAVASARPVDEEHEDPTQIRVPLDAKKVFHRDAELDEGWYDFDVTPAVRRWTVSRTKQFRLVLEKGAIRVKSNHTDKVLELLPDGVFQDSYLLVFSEDEQSRSMRRRRSTSTSASATDPAANMKKPKRKSRRRKGSRNHCKRHLFYVDFTEVGWNDWIVAPPGYDAHFCYGECPLQLSDHLNTTNHAIVQTLVNSVNPSAVPRACCVPTELSPISMLYLDEYEKVVLKNYENMVVEGCGCR